MSAYLTHEVKEGDWYKRLDCVSGGQGQNVKLVVWKVGSPGYTT
jgi:hypothetical protein